MSGHLSGIHDIDDHDPNNDDVERQAAEPSHQSRSEQHFSPHKRRNLHRIGSSPSYRRLSTGPRRMSINDTLNHQTTSMGISGDRTVNFRDYLRAERSLRTLHSPLSKSSRVLQQNRRVANISPSAVALPDMNSSMDSSSFKFEMDDSEKYESITSSAEETKRRREKKRDEAYRQNVHNLAHVGRRGSMLTGEEEMLWETLIDTEEDMEIEEDLLKEKQHIKAQMTGEEEVVDDLDESQRHDNSGVVPWYSPPMQRVFYGKPQVLPHVNWGDLFLDLFFVAAAYNLGVLMISSMNDSDWLRGLLYFIAIFGALYRTWFNDLTFSSRYTVLDQCHRLIWGLKFFAIGVAIIFITPVNVMGDPKHINTSAFVLALIVESLITFGLNVEIYFKALGDRTPIKKHSRRMILNEDLPIIFFYVVAFVLAMLAYFDVDVYGNNGGDGYIRLLAGASDIECSSGGRLLLSRMLGASEVGCPSEGYRKLAADDGCTCHTGINFSTDDIPMTIVYFSYSFHIVFSFLKQLALASDEQDIRDRFVPNNLDYVIHRYGEWIMLMIGEGILSLLIVETTESVEYFIVSCFGVLTVMGIHVLVFESQPSSSDGHAIYRSLRAQLIFGVLVQTLSLGLIAFGVSFKIMLTTIVSDESKTYDSYGPRKLASTPSVSEDTTAALFSASLAIVLISLELMLANHKGAKGTYKRLFKSRDGGEFGIIKKVNRPLLILTLFKLGLLVFTATLSQWERNLTDLSVIAFAIVVSMSVSRVVGWGLVHKEDEIRQMLNTIRTAHTSFKSSMRGFRRTVSDELLNLINGKSGSDPANFSTLQEDAEELLMLNKEVWNTSFECIIAFDRAGRLQYINRTTLNEFGYSSPSEILDQEVSILFRGTEEEDDPLQLRKLGRSSLPPKLIGQQQDGPHTLHAKRKDGTEFPCIVGLKPVLGTDFISGFIRNAANLGGFKKMSVEEFIAAAARGDENEIRRMLLDSNIQLNEGDYDKRTALHLASDNGHAKVVQILCEAHADVNLKDRFGNHPLDCAVEGHHTDCVELLTRFGAKRGKLSQLMDATLRGDSYEIKILVGQGDVDVNETSSTGRTALHAAVDKGLESIVELLCEGGADVNAKDQDRKQPMDFVNEEKHPRLKEILEKYGAKPRKPARVTWKKTTTSSDDMFEDAFDAIIICGNDGLIQKVNNTAVKLFGYNSKEEFRDRGISSICASLRDNPDKIDQAIVTATRKNGTGFLCMVVSKQSEDTKLVTWWIRDMMAVFKQNGIGLSINNQGELVQVHKA